MQIYLYICFFFRTFVAQMDKIIQYIIGFLVYGNQEAAKQVGYTNLEEDWSNYRVVIIPNGHLGQKIVMPDMEELNIEKITKGEKTTWVIRTDIVYNTFFYISRAEELVRLAEEKPRHDSEPGNPLRAGRERRAQNQRAVGLKTIAYIQSFQKKFLQKCRL